MTYLCDDVAAGPLVGFVITLGPFDSIQSAVDSHKHGVQQWSKDVRDFGSILTLI